MEVCPGFWNRPPLVGLAPGIGTDGKGTAIVRHFIPSSIIVLVLASVGFSEEPDKRLPVPDAAAQTAAAKRIKEAHGADYENAKTRADKIELAKKLISEGNDAKGDPAEAYSLFRIARDIAALAGDADLAFQAIDAIGRRYQIDVLQTQADLLTKFAELVDAQAVRPWGAETEDLINEALAAERFEIAKQCVAALTKLAARSGDEIRIEHAAKRSTVVDKRAAEFDELAKATARLKTTPNDGPANLTIGKNVCFKKGDWKRGLPMLTLGDDPQLKDLALRDLADPQDAVEQAQLGEDWRAVARAESRARPILQRAMFWYSKSYARLKGPNKAIVTRRLKEIGPIGFGDIQDPTFRTADLVVIGGRGPFECRSQYTRNELALNFGGTRDTQRAVTAALYWLAHHQMRDGNWSFQGFTAMCSGKSCGGRGKDESLAAATALGLLPFLGAGQTHAAHGPFQKNISNGIYWLIAHQKKDGDLSVTSEASPHTWMYSHAMATMALCECYGMSRDKMVGGPAQKAIDFIQSAQNAKTGGWRYSPGVDGDTSVLGWQMSALKSAQLAGLKVDPAVLDGAQKWLRAVSTPATGVGTFAYRPGENASATMTAVGLFCNQNLHLDRNDPIIVGGVQSLLANLPEDHARSIYYLYYATQAMHNMADKDWDTWNEKMRDTLVKSQIRDGCPTGSWSPDKPARDDWGQSGGRIMMTSLSALTLEVYYRYLPIDPPLDKE